MSEINVQLKDGEPVPVPDSATVAEALKKLDRDLAKQALAAKVSGREVDLTAQLDTLRAGNGESGATVQIEPIVPQTRDGLEVLRHSTAHLLAAAVLDLFPGPFMLVLGDREIEQKAVAVRECSRGDIGVMSVAEFKEMARRLVKTRALTNN